jgi:NO-binding membrane sensor protein with MHYT domain
MEAAGSEDLALHLGQVIPVTFDPTLLVLSYVISLVGAASTLELIHRRTSRRGYYNNLLLFGAAITMGGVAIWSMVGCATSGPLRSTVDVFVGVIPSSIISGTARQLS